MSRVFLPELLYVEGSGFQRGQAVGSVDCGPSLDHPEPIRLPGRAMLPGLVNAHSHAFQRVFRGTTESAGVPGQNFWTWRDAMYRAANTLSPDALYAVARMAFLEMALSGITAVGEFHYIHRDPAGHAYADPNLISKLMVQAAREVGLRICLLRVAYRRAGFEVEPNPLQKRFIEPEDEYLRNAESLRHELDGEFAWAGVAPHSVRAVPLAEMKQIASWAQKANIPFHMHAAEQPAEAQACLAEYGLTPVALLAHEGLLNERFTAVHGVHVTREEVLALANAQAFVCACPATERNLGDGIVPALDYADAGVRVALGSDSQAQIDLLEDARELEYHLRLQKLQRGMLGAAHLFSSATRHGAASLQAPGDSQDYFTVDLSDPSIAGSTPENLISTIVFGMNRAAVRDVIVGGRFIVRDGRHPLQDEIVQAFLKVS